MTLRSPRLGRLRCADPGRGRAPANVSRTVASSRRGALVGTPGAAGGRPRRASAHPQRGGRARAARAGRSADLPRRLGLGPTHELTHRRFRALRCLFRSPFSHVAAQPRLRRAFVMHRSRRGRPSCVAPGLRPVRPRPWDPGRSPPPLSIDAAPAPRHGPRRGPHRPAPAAAPLITPVLLAGCAIMLVSFGVRASFGVFQIPVAEEFGWPRAEFSHGHRRPEPRLGDRPADLRGLRRALRRPARDRAGRDRLRRGAPRSRRSPPTPSPCRRSRCWWASGSPARASASSSPWWVARPPRENRSMAPRHRHRRGLRGPGRGPSGGRVDADLPLLAGRVRRLRRGGPADGSWPSRRSARRRPRRPGSRRPWARCCGAPRATPSYALIFLGFFSCGYQLGFVTAHFPAFVTEMCGPIQAGGLLHSLGVSTTSALGALAIAVIGVTNVAGTLAAGWGGEALRPRRTCSQGSTPRARSSPPRSS